MACRCGVVAFYYTAHAHGGMKELDDARCYQRRRRHRASMWRPSFPSSLSLCYLCSRPMQAAAAMRKRHFVLYVRTLEIRGGVGRGVQWTPATRTGILDLNDKGSGGSLAVCSKTFFLTRPRTYTYSNLSRISHAQPAFSTREELN